MAFGTIDHNAIGRRRGWVDCATDCDIRPPPPSTCHVALDSRTAESAHNAVLLREGFTMRKSRFEDMSTFDRACKSLNLSKFIILDTAGAVRTFVLDGLFWRVSALLSDLDAAVERRLPSA